MTWPFHEAEKIIHNLVSCFFLEKYFPEAFMHLSVQHLRKHTLYVIDMHSYLIVFNPVNKLWFVALFEVINPTRRCKVETFTTHFLSPVQEGQLTSHRFLLIKSTSSYPIVQGIMVQVDQVNYHL